MHSDHQHVLVITAVENGNTAPGRQTAVDPPQIIVAQVLRRGLLEIVHDHALGVQSSHDVLDGAVLARGVQCLQQDDESFPAVRIQGVLQNFHLLQVVGSAGSKFRLFAAVFARPGGQTVKITGPGSVKAKSLSVHDAASCGVTKPHNQYTCSRMVSQLRRAG